MADAFVLAIDSGKNIFYICVCRGLRATPNTFSRVGSLPENAFFLLHDGCKPTAAKYRYPLRPLPVKKQISQTRRSG